jgi:hypothetical protein
MSRNKTGAVRKRLLRGERWRNLHLGIRKILGEEERRG